MNLKRLEKLEIGCYKLQHFTYDGQPSTNFRHRSNFKTFSTVNNTTSKLAVKTLGWGILL